MLPCPSLSCNRRPVASLYGVGAQFVAPGSDCLVCLFLFYFCSFALLLFNYLSHFCMFFSLFFCTPLSLLLAFFFGGGGCLLKPTSSARFLLANDSRVIKSSTR